MDLLELRKQIDEIDDKLIPLLEKRMEVVAQVAEYKAQHGIPVLNEQREKEILDGIKAKCGGDGEAIATVFAAIMKTSREKQHRLIGDGAQSDEA